MNFETELRDRLRDGADAAEVDLNALVEGGFRAGRRLVRRRMVVRTVAVTACSALLVGAVAWSGVLARPPADLGVATVPTASPAPAQVAVTPQAALRILLDLLPNGPTYGDFHGGSFAGKRGLPKDPGVWVRLTYADNAGTSNLSLAVSRLPDTGSCPAVPEPGQLCERSTLQDGSVLKLDRSTAPDGDGLTTWSATLLRPDGVQVSLLADNAEVWKGPGTRPTPPVSMDVLRRVVTNPAWRLSLDEDVVKAAEPLFTSAGSTGR